MNTRRIKDIILLTHTQMPVISVVLACVAAVAIVAMIVPLIFTYVLLAMLAIIASVWCVLYAITIAWLTIVKWARKD